MVKTTVAEIPHMLRMWDRELNTEAPEKVSANCAEKKYWKCPDCGYRWPASPKARYRGSGKCPCHETNKVIFRGVNDILTVVKGLDAFLDENNDFDEIYKQGLDSSMPVNLKCDMCGRTWSAMLKSQVKKDGNGGYVASGCPHYSTVKRKKEDVPYCTEVDAIIRFWDNKNPMNPAITKSNSTDPAHFICKNCGYDWTTEIRSQTRGTGKCKCCELLLVTRKGFSDVFTLIPESKKYYNFDKNKDIDIYSIPLRDTDIPIDWKCPDCGYEWSASLGSRVIGKKGKYSFRKCKNCYLHDENRITPVSSVPKLVKHWDFKKNKQRGLDPNLTSAHLDEPADWHCKVCGYEWENNIRSRMNSNGKCPFCEGSPKAIMTGTNDALSLCPTLSTIYDFDYNKEKGINIYKEGANSTTRAHFKCKKCGNEWDSPIHNRIKKNEDDTYQLVDCPACSSAVFRKTPYSVEYPLLAKMYREDLNNDSLDNIRGARAIFSTYYHWQCPVCNEVFESTLNAMKESHMTSTHGCPYCSHTKVRAGESFADIHPEMIDDYDPDNLIDPNNAFPNCKDSVKWICQECGHHWESSFALRHAGYGNCPVCNRSELIPDINSFAAVYPDYVKYWATTNNRRADEVFYNSSEYHFWHCFDCDMDYRAPIDDIVTNKKKCPYCTGERAIPGKTSLKSLYPDIAKLLSPDETHDADFILPTITTSYIWRCPKCNYDYNASALDMIEGYTCPYCNDRLLMPEYNSFADKHPDLLKEMDPIANYLLPISPYMVLDTSNYKFWWTCQKNSKHKYPMSPRTRLMFQKRNREPCLYCRGQRRKLHHFVSYTKKP